MNPHLIDSCYENNFGLNLKTYHQKICQVKTSEALLIQELNKENRLIFQDGISSTFKLQIYNDLVYLIGDKTCYLCSNVVESAYGSNLNWVSCVIVPGTLKVIGETDIRNSSVIISHFSDLVPQISDENIFYDFIDKLKYTFSECEWFKHIYSVSLYIKLAKFWNYKAKITKLYDHGLLYPLEFAIYSLYKNVGIKNDRILKYFLASLAESTNKIFSFGEINNIFKRLTQSEIENTLAFEIVAQNIHLEKINDEIFADLLEIDGATRYATFVDDTFYLYYMRDRASSVFKSKHFKKDYYKTLKRNFRAFENRIRKEKGYEKVGSYFMEMLLLNKLKAEFPSLTFYPQYSPPWLRAQRIDIYVEECSLAIEYHGAQHYLPIDFFGGIDGLELRNKLDRQKKEKCYDNNVNFFEISYEEDFDFAFDKLKAYMQSLL